MIIQSILLYESTKPKYYSDRNLTIENLKLLIEKAQELKLIPNSKLQHNTIKDMSIIISHYELDISKIYYIKEDPAFIKCKTETQSKNTNTISLGYSIEELLDNYTLMKEEN